MAISTTAQQRRTARHGGMAQQRCVQSQLPASAWPATIGHAHLERSRDDAQVDTAALAADAEEQTVVGLPSQRRADSDQRTVRELAASWAKRVKTSSTSEGSQSPSLTHSTTSCVRQCAVMPSARTFKQCVCAIESCDCQRDLSRAAARKRARAAGHVGPRGRARCRPQRSTRSASGSGRSDRATGRRSGTPGC